MTCSMRSRSSCHCTCQVSSFWYGYHKVVVDDVYYNDMASYNMKLKPTCKVLNHDGYDGEDAILKFWNVLDNLQLQYESPLPFDNLFNLNVTV